MVVDTGHCEIIKIQRPVAQLDKLFPIILKWEGGYVNDPADSGGRTKYGVTENTWKMYGGKKDIADITTEDAKAVMKKLFWDKCKGDEIKNQSVANIVVDWFWGSGYAGIRRLQTTLGIKSDGIFGRETLNALNSSPNQKELFNKIWKAREQYLYDIVVKRPTNKRFLKGWLNRLNDYKYSEI